MNDDDSKINQPELDTDSEGLILEESDLLLEIVRSIVRHPGKVSVDSAEEGKSTTVLTITVDPEDRGNVIGRERRTMDALEHLFTKAAYMEGRRIIIQLEGQDQRRFNNTRPNRDRDDRRPSNNVRQFDPRYDNHPPPPRYNDYNQNYNNQGNYNQDEQRSQGYRSRAPLRERGPLREYRPRNLRDFRKP